MPEPDQDAGDIYTVGHSNHSLEVFLDLLRRHRIEVLIDTRSVPFSRFSPQFNLHDLKRSVEGNGIKYGFYGRELGGRPQDEALYDEEGRVLYSEVAKSWLFNEGVERLMRGIRKHRVAIFCSEEDPNVCHRRLLVSRVLAQQGVSVYHIRGDGSLQAEQELQAQEEQRRANKQPALFGRGRRGRGVEVYSIGFTQSTAAQFFGRLRRAGIKRLLDVRLNNSSQLASFAKKDDLAFFLRELCSADYIHEPLLAPTQQMLDEYKKAKGSWQDYEHRFLELMAERRIENKIDREIFNLPTVLLCSEHTAEHCHRRLVLDYLRHKWGDLDVTHL